MIFCDAEVSLLAFSSSFLFKPSSYLKMGCLFRIQSFIYSPAQSSVLSLLNFAEKALSSVYLINIFDIATWHVRHHYRKDADSGIGQYVYQRSAFRTLSSSAAITFVLTFLIALSLSTSPS